MPSDLYIISIIVASIAAIFSGLTFVNQYLIRFKPKIFINNYINIQFKKENIIIRVEQIILSFTICNSKNTYGVIDDLSLGVIQQNEIQSQYQFIFPAEVSKDGTNFSVFTPIVLNPKSSTLVFVKFANDEFENTIIKDYSINFDLFIKRKTWEKTNHMSLYQYTDRLTKEPKYKVINFAVERDPLSKKKYFPKSEHYEGSIGKYIFFLKKRMARILFIPFRTIFNVLKMLILKIKTIGEYLVNKVYFERIVFDDANKYKKMRVTELGPENYLIKSYDKIVKLIKKFNSKLDTDHQITITEEKGKVELSRNKYTISVYYSGTSTIYVRTLSGYSSRMNMEFGYKNGIIGTKYWYNNKCIHGKYKIALMIFDQFCFQSSYK